jgi:hypothetical protein
MDKQYKRYGDTEAHNCNYHNISADGRARRRNTPTPLKASIVGGERVSLQALEYRMYAASMITFSQYDKTYR